MLGIAVVLLVVTIVTDTPDLVPLVVALGLPLVVAPVSASIRAARARSGVAVSVLADPPVSAVGTDVTVRFRVANRTSRRAPALWLAAPRWEQWHAGAAPGPAPAGRRRRLVPARLLSLPAVRARSAEERAGPVPATRRGVFLLPTGRAWVLDAFGLCGAPGPTVPAATVVLHPRPDPGAGWPSGTVGDPGHDAAPADPGPGRDGPGDLVGIRPYEAGDRLSLIHWPARARFGAWFVRQFAPELGPEWRLVLDDRAGVHRRADFERMLAAAQGLVEHWWRDGRAVELRTLSGRSARLAPVPGGLEQAQVLLATLLPGAVGADPGPAGGTVLTTATGARTLSAVVDRIVVGPIVGDR
jgi:uncharacterized protein (DUF58 family)